MKTLGEIRRNIISFYSTIQDKVTDFSVGSVVNGIIYSFAASLESAYAELESIRKQAYIATAEGEYLDRLIEGTFQLQRNQDTRALGYVVVYADAPLTNFANLELKYAEFDYNTGEFVSGTQGSTKFVGYNVQGDEGVVFSLIQPRNTAVLDSTRRLIELNRPVQFLILPVASLTKGAQSNVREGGIYSFPSPPPGISGVLNTRNPGAVFFSSTEAVSGAPFYSRFTEVLGYDNVASALSVLNAYNFSSEGLIELKSDITRNHNILATYVENPQDGSGEVDTAGIVLEYIDASTNSLTLKQPLENAAGIVPTLLSASGKLLTLYSFNYKGTTYQNNNDGAFGAVIREFVENFEDGLLVEQRARRINPELIFDPDSVLTEDYLIHDSFLVSGATDKDSDDEYRESLIKYLAGLSRATNTALEAGALQVPGVTFARTLPKHLAPRGTTIVLAAGADGYLTPSMKAQLKSQLDRDWKAAGVEVLVKAPDTIPTNLTVTLKLEDGVFRDSITQQVRITFEEYLRSRLPGEPIRYSDLMELISGIGGVLNVYSMLVTKQLDDQTYQELSGQYDLAFLVRASESGIIRVKDAVGSGGDLINYNVETGTLIHVGNVEQANGIVVLQDGNDVEILVGNAALLKSLYTDLIEYSGEKRAEHFLSVILDNANVFDDEDDMLFFLSYVYAEPMEDIPEALYPLDIDNINYKYIRDYTASEIEIFRHNTITVDKTVTPLVGIRFI